MSLQDTLEQIMRRLDSLERRLDELEPPEYSTDIFNGFANPTAQVALVAVNGAATTAMRSDGAPALSQAIAPTWTGEHTFQRTGRTAHFIQDGGGGAIEVIWLRQDDVDEPFIKYQGTATAGGLNRNLVDEGDQASETRMGWLKCEILDDGNQITDGDYHIPFYTLSS